MDERVFKPVTTSFEETWPTYAFAGRVSLVLRLAEWLRGKQSWRGSASEHAPTISSAHDQGARPSG